MGAIITYTFSLSLHVVLYSQTYVRGQEYNMGNMIVKKETFIHSNFY